MTKNQLRIGKFLIGLLLAIGLSVAVLVILSRRASELDLAAGRMQPCPDTPNCVSSLDTDEVHGTDPLWAGDDAEAAWLALEDLLAGLDRTRVVLRTPEYIYAVFTTPILRFVDDVEFRLEPGGRRIDVRSASRVGHSDLGANRARVDELRAALAAALR